MSHIDDPQRSMSALPQSRQVISAHVRTWSAGRARNPPTEPALASGSPAKGRRLATTPIGFRRSRLAVGLRSPPFLSFFARRGRF
jgi:hypothetical protein